MKLSKAQICTPGLSLCHHADKQYWTLIWFCVYLPTYWCDCGRDKVSSSPSWYISLKVLIQKVMTVFHPVLTEACPSFHKGMLCRHSQHFSPKTPPFRPLIPVLCARLAQLSYCLSWLQQVIGWSRLSLVWQLSLEVSSSVTEPCFMGVMEGSVLQELPHTLSSFTCHWDARSLLTSQFIAQRGRRSVIWN